MKQLSWAYTSLTAFETCPRQYHEMRVLKNYPDVMGEAARWGDTVHRMIANRLSKGVSLPEYLSGVEPLAVQLLSKPGEMLVEYKIAVTKDWQETSWRSNDAWCRGIIDVAVVNKANAAMVDWKTGKIKEDPTQLRLFSALLMAKYPQVQTSNTAFAWLKYGVLDRGVVLRAELDRVHQEFEVRVQRLEDAYAADNWPPRKSGLCKKHCAVLSCEYNGRG